MRISRLVLRYSLLTIFLASSIIIPFSEAKAEGGCDFGYQSRFDLDESDPDYVKTVIDEEYDYEEIYCYKTRWTEDDRNDGFNKSIGITISSDEDDEFANDFSSIGIFCSKRKFEVFVYVDFARSVGWSGSGQIKFDNGKPKNLPYTLMRSFESVYLNDSQGFVRNFVKSKNKVTLKIPTVEGTKILAYPKADLLTHRAKFKKAGCSF